MCVFDLSVRLLELSRGENARVNCNSWTITHKRSCESASSRLRPTTTQRPIIVGYDGFTRWEWYVFSWSLLSDEDCLTHIVSSVTIRMRWSFPNADHPYIFNTDIRSQFKPISTNAKWIWWSLLSRWLQYSLRGTLNARYRAPRSSSPRTPTLCTLLQAAILLLFNEQEEISIDELIKHTGGLANARHFSSSPITHSLGTFSTDP